MTITNNYLLFKKILTTTKLYLFIAALPLLGANDHKNFFKNMREEYRRGRELAKAQNEKMRRRKVRERNTKKLVDGLSKRLKRGPWRVNTVLFGSGVIIIWVCYRGAFGCVSRDDDNKKKEKK